MSVPSAPIADAARQMLADECHESKRSSGRTDSTVRRLSRERKTLARHSDEQLKRPSGPAAAAARRRQR